LSPQRLICHARPLPRSDRSACPRLDLWRERPPARFG